LKLSLVYLELLKKFFLNAEFAKTTFAKASVVEKGAEYTKLKQCISFR